MRHFASVVSLLLCTVAAWAEPDVYVVGSECADMAAKKLVNEKLF